MSDCAKRKETAAEPVTLGHPVLDTENTSAELHSASASDAAGSIHAPTPGQAGSFKQLPSWEHLVMRIDSVDQEEDGALRVFFVMCVIPLSH